MPKITVGIDVTPRGESRDIIFDTDEQALYTEIPGETWPTSVDVQRVADAVEAATGMHAGGSWRRARKMLRDSPFVRLATLNYGEALRQLDEQFDMAIADAIRDGA